MFTPLLLNSLDLAITLVNCGDGRYVSIKEVAGFQGPTVADKGKRIAIGQNLYIRRNDAKSKTNATTETCCKMRKQAA